MVTANAASTDAPYPHPSVDQGHDIDPAVYARRWKILVVLCLSLMVVMIANGSLNVALPMMADSLDASTSSLQWMVDSYSLVFAGMLFAAGTLGDRFGRKLALQFGLALFLVGAMIALFSDTAGQVIVGRAVMGFAGAFVMPSTLSILANVFPAHERAKAIAVWAGIAAGGAALGPPISGFLVEHFWWGSVFLVNVPLLVIGLVAGRILLPESKDPDGHRVDIPGAALSILGIGALVYAIIEAPEVGWGSGETLLAFAVALAALAAFGWRELTATDPMLDLRLFRNHAFSAASLGISLCFLAMFGNMFLLTQYLQFVLDYSPFHAGLLMLPMSLIMMVLAPQASRIIARFGATVVIPVGMAVIAGGLAVLSLVGTDSPGWFIYFGLLPTMVGMSTVMPSFTALIMSAVPRERAGVGSAMNDTTRELGGALGVAVLGSVVTTHFRGDMSGSLGAVPEALREKAGSGISGAVRTARELPSDAGRQLVDNAREAFTGGLGTAVLVAAAIVGAAAVVITVLLRRAELAVGREAFEVSVEDAGDAGDDGDDSRPSRPPEPVAVGP